LQEGPVDPAARQPGQGGGGGSPLPMARPEERARAERTPKRLKVRIRSPNRVLTPPGRTRYRCVDGTRDAQEVGGAGLALGA
jgi:hypothetical protein